MRLALGERIRQIARGPATAVAAALAVVLAHQLMIPKPPVRFEPFTAEQSRAGLDRVIRELVLEDATLARAIELLEERAGTPIRIERDWPGRADGLSWEMLTERRISLRLRDVTLAQALGILNYLYLPDHRAQFVPAADGYVELRHSPEVITRTYDVRDLVATALMNPELYGLLTPANPPTLCFFGAPPPPAQPLPRHVRVGQGLMERVMFGTDPLHWSETGGEPGKVTFQGGDLVVTHTREYHLRVEIILEQLRAPPFTPHGAKP